MEFIQRLSSVPDTILFVNQPMGIYTGYGVGGNAKVFVKAYTVQALKEVLQIAKIHGEKCKILGNGTNVLVSDKGYDGVIISLKGLNSIFKCSNCVTALAGASLCKVIKFAYRNNLYGGQPLSGIPATVGGATVMNAGAFGVCMADFVQTVTTLKDGVLYRYENHDCNFAYRSSRFMYENEPIISVNFRFYTDPKYMEYDSLTDCSRQRKLQQPEGKSCGCVFKNPSGDYAGRLIDEAGLKGLRVGGAKVSLKHGNFILADKTATATDVYLLVKHIKEHVYNKFGVMLKEEIEFVGEF